MKTIEQTNRYLSTCVFDDGDWECVLSFCRNEYGGGKVHRPHRGKFHIAFIDFLVWFKYMPGHGEAVTVGKLIGIVGKCNPSFYTLCTYINYNGQLIQKDMEVLPHHVQRAKCDDRKFILDTIFHAGLSYSIQLGSLTSIYVPEDGEFVAVKMFSATKYGIFCRIESSSYVFYYLDNDDNTVGAVSVLASDCEIEKATPKDGIELLGRLSRLGVMWSPREKKFHPVPKRAFLNEKYWYVDDKFCVCQARDMQTPLHNERYKCGNYFTSYGEAIVFLKRLKDLRAECTKQA